MAFTAVTAIEYAQRRLLNPAGSSKISSSSSVSQERQAQDTDQLHQHTEKQEQQHFVERPSTPQQPRQQLLVREDSGVLSTASDDYYSPDDFDSLDDSPAVSEDSHETLEEDSFRDDQWTALPDAVFADIMLRVAGSDVG